MRRGPYASGESRNTRNAPTIAMAETIFYRRMTRPVVSGSEEVGGARDVVGRFLADGRRVAAGVALAGCSDSDCCESLPDRPPNCGRSYRQISHSNHYEVSTAFGPEYTEANFFNVAHRGVRRRR